MKTINKSLLLVLMALITMATACTDAQQKDQKKEEPKVQAQKPNIVFFIADDMERYMFNCLEEGKGKNLTPNIDRLAKEGVLMLNQYVSSSVCTPSRYSCLT